MSFSKAKLKRFNDVDICDSPSAAAAGTSTTCASTTVASSSSSSTSSSMTTSSGTTAHPERREQIEKFFKDAVRANGASASAKEPKEGKTKEKTSLKEKGMRLFRTPSLPHRLRFRQHSDLTSTASTTSSTPFQSTSSTPIKEHTKSASNLKGKEALQFEIRSKNELLENYLSQIDVLKRHVEQLKETEARLKEENAQILQKNETLVSELTEENRNHKNTIDCLGIENAKLLEKANSFESELKNLTESHSTELENLKTINSQLEAKCENLNSKYEQYLSENSNLNEKIQKLDSEIVELKENLSRNNEERSESLKELDDIKSKNEELQSEVKKLQDQIEADALSYAVETKNTFVELESLRNEKNSLRNDLATKSELIHNLQEEVLDKNCEIDAHRDTIRSLEEEKQRYVNFDKVLEQAEEKVRIVEIQAEQKIKQLESNVEQTIERERNYWRSELNKRQEQAENQVIKIELEKQDVMILLESTNDMLRERDEKIQKYEDQLRKGLEYYINLTDTLQKQVVDIKADMAKTITEKYNYQLTLSNTRSTVNILMERLKKSDSDVESLKTELEAVQAEKKQLEANYTELQNELAALKNDLAESEKNLNALRESSTALQNEERIDENVEKYIELYLDLKNKDDNREVYMADMRKALDEFATVLELAQLEIDNKDKCLTKLKDENETLKLENLSLKSKANDNTKCIAEKDTDEQQEVLIDSQLKAECDKITNWLLSTADENNEVKELLKEKISNNINTPKSLPRTPKNTTPRTPRSPRTPRTPKSMKTVLFPGKENLLPTMEVIKSPLKTWNK
ncbi:myosin-10 [Eupeodes corollae]|uniref:myosin-10 n=1 Tax=Eupeodes corollae TaxID=290404 RepID=UPI0024904B20|nr:myosin-10 [Eupeodes corollae]